MVRGVLANGAAVFVVEQEGGSIQALAGLAVHLVDQDIGFFPVIKLNSGGFSFLHFHRSGCVIQDVTIRCPHLGDGVPSFLHLRQTDHAIPIGGIGADDLTIHPPHFKLDSAQTLTGFRVLFDDLQAAHGLVAELQGRRLPCFDLDALGHIIQHIAVLGPHFGDDHRAPRLQARNEDRALAVCHELSVLIADHGAIGIDHLEHHIGQRFSGNAVDLLDQQAALGGVLEGHGDHILVFPCEMHRLRAVIQHIAIGGGDLFHHISALLHAGEHDGAIDTGLILAYDGAAGAGCAAQIPHPEPGPLQGLAGDAVYLAYNQSRQRSVFKSQHLPLTAFDKALLRSWGFDGITVRGFQLGHLVPAVLHIFQPDHALFIGVISAQIPQLSGFGLVAPVPDLEFGALQRISCHTIDLDNFQGRLFVIFEEHLSIPVGIEGHKLGLCIQQIGFRHRLLNHFIGTRQQIFHLCAAICTGGHFPYPGAVHGPHLEHRSRHHFPGIGIPLMDSQVGALVVSDGQRAGFAREELHLVFLGIENVVIYSGGLFDRIDTGFQIAHQDFTSIVCGSIQVMRPVLDFADAEGNAAQRCAVGALLQQPQSGLNGVGEHKFAGLTRLQVNDPLGIVDHIAVGFLFGHHISARLQLGQVDHAVFIGGKFFRSECGSIAFDLKDHIGNDLAGVGGIDLY